MNPTNPPTSIEFFLEQSQRQLDKRLGKAAPRLTEQDIEIKNRKLGDGHFILQVQKLNTIIRGEVYTQKQEMHLYALSPTEKRKFAYREMPDACSLTKRLVGEAELGEDSCQDGVLDPNLVDALKKFDSLKEFDRFCKFSYQDYQEAAPKLTQSSQQLGEGYDLRRVQRLNPHPLNGAYFLLYEHPGNGFYCRANISTLGKQIMVLSSGSRQEWADYQGWQLELENLITENPTVALMTHEMTDACRMSEDLVGEEEHPGECLEFTQFERTSEHFGEAVWDMGVIVAALEFGGVILSKANAAAPTLGKFITSAANTALGKFGLGMFCGYGLVRSGLGKYTGAKWAGEGISDGISWLVGPADTSGVVFQAVDGVFTFLGLNQDSWL